MLYWMIKVVVGSLFRLVFRLKVTGQEHLPAEGPVILAANHQAFCDSLFLPLSVSRRVTFLAKAEYFDDPKQAWFYRALGQIPIRRGRGSEGLRALQTAAAALGEGKVIAVYPEGTRSPDGHCHKGHNGIARLALETRAPVIPIGLRGTSEVQPIGAKLLRPFRRVSVNFGAPLRLTDAALLEAGDNKHVALRKFTGELMTQICELSGRPYRDTYAPRVSR